MSMFLFSSAPLEVHLHCMTSTFLSRLYNLQARKVKSNNFIAVSKLEKYQQEIYHFRAALLQLASINLHSVKLLSPTSE